MGFIDPVDGVQFLYTIDPQHVSAEVAESVLAGFCAWVVFGRESGEGADPQACDAARTLHDGMA
jgi:hypothetical protein